MKSLFINFVLFTIILYTFTPCFSYEISYEERALANACMINETLTQRANTIEEFKMAYKCLAGKELTAIRLEKGRKFSVKSLQPMSVKTQTGTIVSFETLGPEHVFIDKEPSKLVFSGEIVDNRPPGKAGSSGKIKIQIQKVKIENVTYPVSAFISKMNKKPVMFGAIGAASTYVPNLKDRADNGTITINQVYKDPCEVNDCVTGLNAVVKPLYYLAGALLQTADLLICPIAALLVTGQELYVPENTEFEIKLEEDLPVLNL